MSMSAFRQGLGNTSITGTIGSFRSGRFFSGSGTSDAAYENMGQYLIEIDPLTLQIKSPDSMWKIGNGRNLYPSGNTAWELNGTGMDTGISFLQTNRRALGSLRTGVYHIDLDTGRLTRQSNLKSGSYRGFAQDGNSYYASDGQTIFLLTGGSIELPEDIDSLDLVLGSISDSGKFLLAATQNSSACSVWKIPLDSGGDFAGTYSLVTTVSHDESSVSTSPACYAGISYAQISWPDEGGSLKEVLYLSSDYFDSDASDEIAIIDFQTGAILNRVHSAESGLSLSEPVTLTNGSMTDYLIWANPRGIQGVDSRLFIIGDFCFTLCQPSVNIKKYVSVDGGTTYVDADTPSGPYALVGSDLYFKLVVTNTGLWKLGNITLQDTDFSLSSCSIPESLASKASFTCVIGPIKALAGQQTDTSTVTAQTRFSVLTGKVFSDTDDANYFGADPGIKIEKTPATQTILSGGTATFTIKVTNIGNVTLTNVTLTDTPPFSGCTPPIPSPFTLAPGTSQTFQCTVSNVTQSFTNVATATGTPPAGPNVSATATAQVIVSQPGISITKTPSTQTIVSGGTATFNITVTNTGNVPLTNVNVTDVQAPGCARTIGTLAAGASSTYSCTVSGVTQSFTNIATATGTPPAGLNVSATATAQVIVSQPGISITKTPATQTIVSGGTATFSITVTNTGNVPLTSVAVADTLVPGCAQTIGTLAVGASSTYTCTTAVLTAGFTNTATATGTPPVGSNVSATATADVVVEEPAPGISITKEPLTQTVASGGTATFTITVTNTGNVPLTNVGVADTFSPCDRVIGDLAVGGVSTYPCTVSDVTQSFINTAIATGTPPAGPPNVNATATADVVVQ
ncbi:MAG: hypothetical protein AB1847_20185 [bacterium]